jgi:hypothetical protein
VAYRGSVWLVLGSVALVSALCAFQRPFRQYYTRPYENFPLPPDWQEKTEWVFGRLLYPPASFGGGRGFGFRGDRGFGRFGGGNWAQGSSSWTTDYPRSDRHFVQAVRRLTRIHTRSVEQGVNLDEGDQYDWPWIYAVEVGQWTLTDAQAKALREYLLRGGFLMCDDFHGMLEWAIFEQSMRRVFPDRPIVEIENVDPIFHTIYDLDDRYQVPGVQYVQSRRTYERSDGTVAHWRGVYDDKGRLMVAICFNSDLGDAWEWADEPRYPEKFSALAIRIGVNYVVYAMTH